MKKVLCIFTVMFVLMTAAYGCGKNEQAKYEFKQDTAENALTTLFNAVKASSAEDVVKISQVSYDSSDIESENTMINDKAFGEKFQKARRDDLKYTIGTSETDQDMTYISIEAEYTDFSQAFNEALPIYMTNYIFNMPESPEASSDSASQSDSDREYIDAFNTAYEKYPPVTTKESFVVTTQKIEDKFYVRISGKLAEAITCGVMKAINNLG